MKQFELKPLVSVSLSEQAIAEVNNAINDLTQESIRKWTDREIMAKLALQRHLFDLVPTVEHEQDEP